MLLDTHVVLWLLNDDPELGEDTRQALSAASALRASVVTLWEVAIKADLGKLTVPDDFPARVEASGVEWLALTPDHCWTSRQVTGLPHRDPFDRMLLSVSACLGVPLVTADRTLLASSISPQVDLIDARR